MNVEYRHESGFSTFFNKVQGKRVLLMYDINTMPYALEMKARLQDNGAFVVECAYPDKDLVPTEDKCDQAYALAAQVDYVLAVGSGTLNDMSKSVATRRGIPCGVLATAASMDGYCSKGAAVIRNQFKVTDEVRPPEDILIDLEIIRSAPRIMTASGFGDIMGKFTCLTDWQMANIVKGEPIHAHAFSLMEQARSACMDAFDGLTRYEDDAVAKLMQALITAGISMAECGNSRPASGSEHHISHYLEMDFVRRGERIPMHGLKVAIGTLISMEVYNYILENRIEFEGAEKVYALAKSLPPIDRVKFMLEKMGCPLRFSELGVPRASMEDTIENAYTVRDRFTVLTLAHELGLLSKLKPILMEKYY